MSQPRICPNCRSAVPVDAPEGVCPACALRAGFDVSRGTDVPTVATPAPHAPPVSAEQLADKLPELEQFELIGRGGMGAVYSARHRELDRRVAVKVLDAALQANPAFAERFTREARTMAQLDHPNVVSVYDFGHRDGLYYLIMELVDGVNLRQTIEAGRLAPEKALAMVPRICEALQYAHDRGVVHRDIKPENILVDRSGTIKIADFGLAKLIGGDRGRRLTHTEQIMGTPNYMAPEQIETPTRVDHRADIFALGVVFYELLTGELPVGRFPLPSKKVNIDVRLDDVVLRTLEKEPSLRYQQASELKTDVESVASGGEPVGTASIHGFAVGSAEAAAQAASAAVDAAAAAVGMETPKETAKPRDFEYRSKATLLGLPLVHIYSSRDREGKHMRTANGIIAIGDIAIGFIAIGGFAFGGITFGGINVGLIGFGGVTAGLLTALGGLAFGGYTLGGFSMGLVSRGAADFPLFDLAEPWLTRATLLGWGVMSVGLTVGIVGAVYAWLQAARAR